MNSAFQLLVVDDDALIGESLKLALSNRWKIHYVPSPAQIPKNIFFHAAFVDMHLTKNSMVADGPKIIAQIASDNGRTEIVAMSGDLSMELMEDCLKAGASKFLAKPLLADEVNATLEKIEALWGLIEVESRPQQSTVWIGSSQASQSIKRQIAELRGEAGPILIEGETGTGKEIAFRLLHQQEPTRPAITVNIASIPENLFESELYGHVKGAFTGADSLKIGLCEAAQGGDLFLDEVEALPLNQQVKLLRFLESGEVRRVGSKETLHVKTRVIAASNQNLSQLVKDGKFREDLQFRLTGKKISLPPLRDRLDDVDELAKYFLAREKPRHNKMFSEDALKAFKKYSWPGNVRELKRVCEQIVLTSPLPVIRKEDVERLLTGTTNSVAAATLDFEKGLSVLVEEFEAQIIRQILKDEPDIDKAAAQLKVSRSNLYKKIKDYGI